MPEQYAIIQYQKNLFKNWTQGLQQKMKRQYDYIIKMVMVGSSAVGKTSILRRFADNDYNQFYISTIGIDFRFKSISLDNFYIKLQIWDTAGQERFKGITKSYYTNADAVIVVYDVNDSKTFDEIKSLWLNEVRNFCRNQVRIFVLCNKCDTNQHIIKPAHKKFFDENQIQYYMVSAKTGKGVEESFKKIVKKMINIIPKVEEKALSMSLRQSHFEGGNIKKQKQQNTCC